MEITNKSINEIKPYEKNPRKNDEAVEYVANSIREFGFKVPIVIDKDGVIVAGHTRYKAAKKLGLEEVPCVVADDLSEEQVKAFRLADNKVGEKAEWDESLLQLELDGIFDIDMAKFDFDLSIEEEEETQEEQDHKLLTDRFIVPPFSVLDAKQGYWKDRKKIWNEKIGDTGQARSGAQAYNNMSFANKEKYGSHAIKNNGTSILDPVLSEIICKWFLPDESGGKCFDTFAGDTVFGYVCASLGNEFKGIELRQEQADFNNKKTEGLSAEYFCDDGRNVLKHIAEGTQDLFFSCPPYFDLEVYSDKENDASNQATYEEFYAILDEAFTNAVKCLKQNRFAVVVCGDVRNKNNGFYYNFGEDIIRTFERNGMPLYNRLVLLDPIGTAALRANKTFKTRKMVKIHQDVLVFYKGDTKEIKNIFREITEDYESEDLEL